MCQNKVLSDNDGKYITKEGLKHSSAKLYYNGGLQSIKDGVLSQLEAENMKSILQKNPPAQALGRIRKEVRQTQKSLEYGLAAANDMTERLSRMVSTAKQKLNK